MNLVRLFTSHGAIHVDSDQLARGRTHLTIYTARGNRLKDVGATRKIREDASYGVHRDNLYASQALADAATERIFKEIYGDRAVTTGQHRQDEPPLSSV